MDVFSPSVLTAIKRVASFNNGAVNVPNVKTLLTVCDMGLCVTGQLFWVTSRVYMTKGGVAGDSFHDIYQDFGTATIALLSGLGFVETKLIAHPAGLQWASVLTVMGIVTAPGTLGIGTRGQSLGSDSTCGAGDANMAVIKINR